MFKHFTDLFVNYVKIKWGKNVKPYIYLNGNTRQYILRNNTLREQLPWNNL